jgi:cytosine/adenosine deaminase-related metal-dependent hydrolase
MAISLRATVVFPVDLPPIENGVVVIEGERIVSVGKSAEGEEPDLGDVALFPGFVNAHTHLEFSHLRQPLGQAGMRLVDWTRLVIGERGRRDNACSGTIFAGLEESVAAGVTTIADITTADIATKSSSGVDLTSFAEVIGFSRARAESAFAAAETRLAHSLQSSAKVGISPHAPYTVSPDLLERLVKFAQVKGLPLAMHVAESREELQLLQSGSGPYQELLEERSMWDPNVIPSGSHAMQYLRVLSHAPRALVIHGNYLDYEELRFLGANRDHMSLVYCPRTHTYFGHDTYPLAAARAMRVRVALGTDSRASNPDLSILAEMRHVFRVAPTIDPLEVLRMGTLSAAKALGRDNEAGSITPGKLANLVAVPIASGTRGAPKDVLVSVLVDSSQPSLTYAAGRRLHT